MERAHYQVEQSSLVTYPTAGAVTSYGVYRK